MNFQVTDTQGILCDEYFKQLAMKALSRCPIPLNDEYRHIFKDCIGQFWALSAYPSETRVNAIQVVLRISDGKEISNEQIIGSMWVKPLIN